MQSAVPKRTYLDRQAITELVQNFYGDVRADETVGPIFEAELRDRWDIHLPRMVEFWSTLMIGARSFSGNVYGKHMALDGVTPEHFQSWLRLWFTRTDSMFTAIPAGDLQEIATGIARNLFRGYFGLEADFDSVLGAARTASGSTAAV